MAEKAQVNDLLIDNNSEQHTIDTEFGELSVWIKDLTWIERQEALSQFVGLKNDGDGNMIPQIDFGGFWKFVFTKCITKSEPSLTTKQLLTLKPEIAQEIQKLLPSFDTLMEGMQGGITGHFGITLDDIEAFISYDGEGDIDIPIGKATYLGQSIITFFLGQFFKCPPHAWDSQPPERVILDYLMMTAYREKEAEMLDKLKREQDMGATKGRAVKTTSDTDFFEDECEVER